MTKRIFKFDSVQPSLLQMDSLSGVWHLSRNAFISLPDLSIYQIESFSISFSLNTYIRLNLNLFTSQRSSRLEEDQLLPANHVGKHDFTNHIQRTIEMEDGKLSIFHSHLS